MLCSNNASTKMRPVIVFSECGGIVYPSPVKVRKRGLHMTTTLFGRRDFFLRLTAIFSVLSARTAIGAGRIPRALLADDYGISHTADAIHQEVVFRASRKRIYDALTDTRQFDRIIQLSKAGMSYGKKPTDISRQVGGAFSLFGGYIVGRHIELTPNE